MTALPSISQMFQAKTKKKKKFNVAQKWWNLKKHVLLPHAKTVHARRMGMQLVTWQKPPQRTLQRCYIDAELVQTGLYVQPLTSLLTEAGIENYARPVHGGIANLWNLLSREQLTAHCWMFQSDVEIIIRSQSHSQMALSFRFELCLIFMRILWYWSEVRRRPPRIITCAGS